MGESLRHSRLGSFESTNEVGIAAAAAAVGFPRSPLTFASRRFKKVRRFDEVHFRITFKLIKTQL